MEYKKEFKGLYQFSNRVSDIWKGHKEYFSGTYKIIDSFTKKQPVYRDDYIEPYSYRYDDYVVIEDIETGKRQELELVYFNMMFKFKVKETKIFKNIDEVRDFLDGYKGIYDIYKTNNGFELDLGEE